MSIGKGITKRIDGTVQVAEIVTRVKQIGVEHDTLTACLAECLNNGVNVPLEENRLLVTSHCSSTTYRRPAENERAHDHRDRPQCFSRLVATSTLGRRLRIAVANRGERMFRFGIGEQRSILVGLLGRLHAGLGQCEQISEVRRDDHGHGRMFAARLIRRRTIRHVQAGRRSILLVGRRIDDRAGCIVIVDTHVSFRCGRWSRALLLRRRRRGDRRCLRRLMIFRHVDDEIRHGRRGHADETRDLLGIGLRAFLECTRHLIDEHVEDEHHEQRDPEVAHGQA